MHGVTMKILVTNLKNEIKYAELEDVLKFKNFREL